MIPITKIYDICKITKGETPLLYQWLEKCYLQEIFSEKPGVPRKGFPKEGRKPLSPERKLFCMVKTFNSNLKLKTIAEELEQNYVVIRRWNNDSFINEYIDTLRSSFSTNLVNYLNGLLKDYDHGIDIYEFQSNEKLHMCITAVSETSHYDRVLRNTLEDIFLEKVTSLPEREKAIWFQLFQIMTGGWNNSFDIYSQTKSVAEKKLLIDDVYRSERRMDNGEGIYLDYLVNQLEKGEVETVISGIKDLQRNLKHKNSLITELSISVINKGKKQGE